MRLSIKQRIQQDIKISTYRYFKNTDMIFCDFIYGDKFYATLNDVVYWYFVTKDLDWELEYNMLAVIDTVELVSRLYEKFIKADIYYQQKYSEKDFRHRKNYIIKSLQRATPPLLDKQFDEHSRCAQELKRLRFPKKFHYYSLDSDDGNFIEYLSWKDWEKSADKEKDLDIKRVRLEHIKHVLNNTEKTVVNMVLENKPYEEISKELKLQQDRIRKILFSAKKKLRMKQLNHS